MDDRRYEAQRARVLRSFNRWHDLLQLFPWHVDLVWHRDKIEGHSQRHASDVCLMSTHVSYAYLMATINVDLSAIEDISDEFLDYTMAHECAHVLVNEMRYFEESILREERVCTVLGRIFVSLASRGSVAEDEAESIMDAWQATLNEEADHAL